MNLPKQGNHSWKKNQKTRQQQVKKNPTNKEKDKKILEKKAEKAEIKENKIINKTKYK